MADMKKKYDDLIIINLYLSKEIIDIILSYVRIERIIGTEGSGFALARLHGIPNGAFYDHHFSVLAASVTVHSDAFSTILVSLAKS